MKSFSTIVAEAAVQVPEFSHPDLVTPRDPEGKFWKAIAAANEDSDTPKSAYLKALKSAKDLYTYLIQFRGEAMKEARSSVSDAIKILEEQTNVAQDSVSAADLHFLRTCLFIISNIDSTLKNKLWFKKSHVDIKAGYVPFSGASKDSKIKYRMVYHLEDALSAQQAKDITKLAKTATPLHADYVAGVEFDKERKAFAILISNSIGYKR